MSRRPSHASLETRPARGGVSRGNLAGASDAGDPPSPAAVVSDPPPDSELSSDAQPASGSPSEPIYQRVARELREAIADGRYKVGDRLPTELELCERFSISRFTVRAAIRLLSNAGLVTRRQRVGTVVIATPDAARFTHEISHVDDLLQYAQDTTLQLVYVGRLGLSAEQAASFSATPGEEWIYAIGLRRDPERRPICVARLFLNPMLHGIEKQLRNLHSAVYAVIEREHGLRIDRVEQELQGALLDTDDAANLDAAPGAPALRIVRRYYAEDGRLLEVAENIHPSDRFTYRMTVRR